MLTPSTSPAMAEPVMLLEQALDNEGQRIWSLEDELHWYCYRHSRGQTQAWLNGVLGVHGFVVLDCSNFRQRRFAR